MNKENLSNKSDKYLLKLKKEVDSALKVKKVLGTISKKELKNLRRLVNGFRAHKVDIEILVPCKVSVYAYNYGSKTYKSTCIQKSMDNDINNLAFENKKVIEKIKEIEKNGAEYKKLFNELRKKYKLTCGELNNLCNHLYE